ncbi:MAG: TolC family protein, partial [Deltaproteobacteria bacterium]|nr:TolC family protein [Deltaproteobacteria bacterium]
MKPKSAFPFRWAILFLSLLLTSCVLFRPAARNNPEGDLATEFSLYREGEETPPRWWQGLGSSELNALVAEALGSNLDLQVAWARLRQVRAQAVQSSASLYPDLSLAGDASYKRLSDDRRITETEEYLLGLASGYELDLWGKIRSEGEAAALAEQAAEQDLHAAAMTLAAETAGRWVEVVSLRRQRGILERQLETNRMFLELVELRFFMSKVSALDVYQQKQVVEQVASEIPLVEEEERLLLHQLALLLGRSPQDFSGIEAAAFPDPGPFPALGLPADLLGRRPDVRAAGLRLKGADWQVAAARADR